MVIEAGTSASVFLANHKPRFTELLVREKTHEHIRSGTSSHIDRGGTEAVAGARVPGVRHALRRAAYAFSSGSFTAPPEGVPRRFVLFLLPTADQPGGQRGTGQAAGESDGQ